MCVCVSLAASTDDGFGSASQALRHHPDRNQGSEAASKKFKEVRLCKRRTGSAGSSSLTLVVRRALRSPRRSKSCPTRCVSLL